MNIKYLAPLGCIAFLVNPTALAVAQSLHSSESTPTLSGKYFGKFTLTMNSHQLAYPNLFTELDGVTYMKLGQSVTPSYWQWDFDKNEVIFGTGTVVALGQVHVPFQAFNQDDIENKRKDQEHIVNGISEITAPFTDNGDGTYTLDYAQKMYLDIQQYPIGNGSATFSIIANDDQLTIKTIDFEAPEVELNGEAGKDGIPGTRLEHIFPFTVQAQWDSTSMIKDNGTDSNNDGVTDAVAIVLGANPQSLDSDNDGLSDVEELGAIFVNPTDSDGDNVPDISDPTDPSDHLAYQTLVKLISSQTIRLTSPDSETIYSASAFDVDETWNKPDNIKDLDLTMGVLSYQVTNLLTEHRRYSDARNGYQAALMQLLIADSPENEENLKSLMPAFAEFADVLYQGEGDWRDFRYASFADISKFKNELFKSEVDEFNDNVIVSIEFPSDIPDGLVLTRRYVPVNSPEGPSYHAVTWQPRDHKTIDVFVDTAIKSHSESPDTPESPPFDDVQLIIGKAKPAIVIPPPPPPLNQAPSVSINSVADINEGEEVTLTARAIDPDGNNLWYSWQQTAGDSVDFIASSSEISFTAPDVSEDQQLTFSVTVSDYQFSITDTVSFNVLMVNTAPSVAITNNSKADITEGKQVSLAAVATDKEQDDLTYTWTQTQGSTVSFDKNAATIAFSAPDVSNDELLSFFVEVSDGDLSANATIDIEVKALNDAPTGTVTGPESVQAGEAIALVAAATDENNDDITYLWTQTSGTKVEFSSNTAEITFSAPDVLVDEVLSFSVEISDGQLSDTATISIAVTPKPIKNTSPQISLESELTVNERDKIIIQATVTDEQQANNELTMNWQQISGPEVNYTADNAQLSFIAPSVLADKETKLEFSITVNDGLVAITEKVSVTVINTDVTTPLVGVFIDSPVGGVDYVAGSITGRTNSKGEFNYHEGDTVSFSIGGIELGSALAQAHVTPLTLADTDDINADTVVNIVRLLQTLDSDKDASNGIAISSQVINSAANINLDLTAGTEVFAQSAELTNFLKVTQPSGTVLVSTKSAITHFQTTLDALPKQDDKAVVKVTEPVVDEPIVENKKSGGSTSWFVLALIACAAISRKSIRQLKWTR
ncbi:MAG: hypothetical protein GY787_25545 [Alteromonadales bacterium]|nr:hypothetical protein [Alteromonadales bacterium]